jgi:hypothetical protein
LCTTLSISVLHIFILHPSAFILSLVGAHNITINIQNIFPISKENLYTFEDYL